MKYQPIIIKHASAGDLMSIIGRAAYDDWGTDDEPSVGERMIERQWINQVTIKPRHSLWGSSDLAMAGQRETGSGTLIWGCHVTHVLELLFLLKPDDIKTGWNYGGPYLQMIGEDAHKVVYLAMKRNIVELLEELRQ